MASNNNRGGNRGRGGRNNNPEGHNQHDRGLVDSARERPFTAAAAIGGAVAAGVFLWSKRNQISEQIADLSDQLSEWRDGLGRDSDIANEQGLIASASRRGGKSQSEIAEEALSLKATGKTAEHPTDPTVDDQIKVGSVAY